MRSVLEVIVVEGRYDKNTVSQAVNGTIIETSGFGVFKDDEKVALLRRLAERRGLIILTDGDSAGFLIRSHLKSVLGTANVKHAYIPDIWGREKRKRVASKEGKLGVEGMNKDVIIAALERAGATFTDETGSIRADAAAEKNLITKTDLYNAGLSGGTDSASRRSALLKKLDLPERLSANGLLDVLNALYSREEFFAILS